jgi:hypothetical protein
VTRDRYKTARIFLAALAVVAALAGVELYAVWRSHEAHPPPPTTASAVARQPAQGSIDAPLGEAVVGPRVVVSGWAIAPSGVRAVEMRIDALTFNAKLGLPRDDVAKALKDANGAATSGFEFVGDLTPHAAAPGVDRRILTVVVIDNEGGETVLGRRSIVEPSALTRWRDVALPASTPFYLLPALSGIGLGGARELDGEYTAYVSPTARVGMRVPILYLRTTRGPRADYNFDPRWDIERRCGERRIAEDSLGPTLGYAAEHELPVLVTLNGGIWADAACDVPDWDANDHLEQDKANCQWNEHNEVMPDDALKNLPGSQDAPQLGRSLTFNVYAREVRRYKKRNLQEAAREIVAFARAHPRLFVGVNLDPDTYMNPFFGETQWYDYNPGTLKQFRHWLAGDGPYAGAPEPGVPDLSAFRRRKPLTLADVQRISGRPFKSFAEVDPPRAFPRDPAHPFWQDPWVREWEMFRRHLVALHYEELSQWLVEAGVPRDRIWTSQGFMAPHAGAMPFALTIESPVKNYDSGGMSVAGSKPPDGHLGAILYGASAVNDIPMENDRSLFATFASLDPDFGVVEFNTADLRNPAALPTYAAGYRALRDLWNAGARFVSPMAWNGSNGVNAGKPGYVSFTAWRNTPLEEAARDFLLARYGLPRGTPLWTFGTPRHADGDAWRAEVGAIALGNGMLSLTSAPDGRAAIVSPTGLALAPDRVARVVTGLPREAKLAELNVYVRSAGAANWENLIAARGPGIATIDAGRMVARSSDTRAAPIDQLKVEFVFEGVASAVPLTRIALLPAPPKR